MSYFASSASPEVAVWHEKEPTHLMQDIEKSLEEGIETIINETREIFVTTEHKMEDICAHLGIHPFHHNFFGSLIGCTLILHTNGHLEIRRGENQKHTTVFPVQLIAA